MAGVRQQGRDDVKADRGRRQIDPVNWREDAEMTHEEDYLLYWLDDRLDRAESLRKVSMTVKGKQRRLLKQCASNVLLRTLAELVQHPALSRSS